MQKIVFIMAGLLATLNVWGEVIHLTNGDVIRGEILETKAESILVETDHGNLEIDKDRIERIDYSEEAQQSGLKDRNGALILRPLPTLVGAMDGYFDIVVEGQTAFSKEWAVTAITEYGNVYGISVTSLQIGPQYRPGGEYLKGFLVGIYPGIILATDTYDYLWMASLTFETGYQWVTDSGFVFGLTTGASYLSAGYYVSAFKFNLSAHLGFAFKDPWVRAR